MPVSGPSFFACRRRDFSAGRDAKPPRNKLRKRPPFARYTQSEVVTLKSLSSDAEEASMGNHLSALKSRPARPPRPCPADLPSLPSLPIYQTISSHQSRSFDVQDEPKPPIPPKSPSRKSSVSIKDWPLRGLEDEAPAMPAKPPSLPHPKPSIGRRCSRHTASYQAYHPPPRYDRASHLAESYQSLLPEIDHDTSWTIDWDDPLPNPPKYKQHQSVCEDDSPAYPHSTGHTLCPTPAPLPTRSSTLSPSSARPPPLRTSRPRIPKIPSSPDLRRTPVPPRCDAVSPTTGPGLGHQARQLNSALGSLSGSTGLALSAELLTHELTHALNISADASAPSTSGGGGTSKLQMLLLIEAYEAVLETCRRELSNIAALEAGPVAGGENELGESGVLRRWEAREEEGRRGRRQWHIQEAIGILGHWLGVLYRIYDGIYEEPWEESGLGMI
ncbi:hypothetical protein QBC39DRAFT_402845 [Podospora conica]|nr:hypothetical protein QBC39DRAFT_402845 [Schizothecium conicum]